MTGEGRRPGLDITAAARRMRSEPERPDEPEWSRGLFAGFSRGQLSNLHGVLEHAIRDLTEADGSWELLQEVTELKHGVYARSRNFRRG